MSHLPLDGGLVAPARFAWMRLGLAVFSVAVMPVAVMPQSVQAKTVLSNFVTTGEDIVGAKVTARFLDGGTETISWQKTGKASGGVAGTGWSLGQRLDSFQNPWLLNSDADTTLSALTINLLEGNALFDIESLALGGPGTQGSKLGAPFTVKLGASSAVVLEPSRVSYDLPIDISQGDLFAELTLEWDEGFRGSSLAFVADSDSGTAAAPVRLEQAPSLESLEAIAIPLVPPDRVKPRPVVSIPAVSPDNIQVETPIESRPMPVPEPSFWFGLLGMLCLGVAKGESRSRA